MPPQNIKKDKSAIIKKDAHWKTATMFKPAAVVTPQSLGQAQRITNLRALALRREQFPGNCYFVRGRHVKYMLRNAGIVLKKETGMCVLDF